ncbi:MAG: NTP pyrophosphatase (non-canonical NTP hydrolase) [Crocinitomicaceae bacterium]|jgi:NTP pyrophosphatase (non-canonical NTP hydrolase)
MSYQEIQKKIREHKVELMSPAEIMLAAAEEFGEVAQEVALLEQIGTKENWKKKGDKERLAEEIRHTMNCLAGLANYYNLEL